MIVQELMLSVLPRLDSVAGVDIVQAANAATRGIGKRLAARRSDLVKEPWSVRFPAASKISLPPEFLGFAEDPTLISGSTRTALSPLRPGERAELDREGVPARYELIWPRLFLFPYPATEVLLKGMAFQLPPPVTDMMDSLPWDGVLDDLLTEAAFRVASVGMTHISDPAFESYIGQELDRILPVRTGARPRRAAGYHY